MKTYQFIAPTSYDVAILKRWLQDEGIIFLELKLWENPLYCSGSFLADIEPKTVIDLHNEAVKSKLMDSFHMIREEAPDELKRLAMLN